MAAQQEVSSSAPLPASEEAERFVLGACLSYPKAVHDARQLLKPGDLFAPAHQVIFSRIAKLAEMGLDVNRVSLKDSLEANDQLGEVGGLSYLVSLDEGMPARIDVPGWCGIIIEKWKLRRLIEIQSEALVASHRGAKTADQIAREIDHRLYTDLRIKQQEKPQSLEEISDSEPMEERLDPSYAKKHRGAKGVYSGFLTLDELTDGLHHGESWVFGAPPRGGKSAIMLQIAYHNAKEGVPNIIFSLEMTKQALYRRLLCRIAMVPYMRYMTGDLGPNERIRLIEADHELRSLPIYIDAKRQQSIADIGMRYRRAKDEYGVQFGQIDFIQKIVGSKAREQRNYQLSEICDGLANLADEVAPWFLYSQLNRYGRRLNLEPSLEDLEGSGAIEQVGQTIIFPWREDLVAKKEEERIALQGKAKFILAKNRNGESRTIPMEWVGWLMMYRERKPATAIDY